MIQATLINLHSNEYIKKLLYYSFGDNLDNCMGSSKTLNSISNKMYFPKKQKI